MTEYSVGANGGDAFDWAALMHNLIAEFDVSAIDFMWGFFGEWENPEFFLITLKYSGSQYLGYELNKHYFTMGQFSRFVRPGYVRVGAESKEPDILVTAYQGNDEVVLVLINNRSRKHAAVVASNSPLTMSPVMPPYPRKRPTRLLEPGRMKPITAPKWTYFSSTCS